MVGTVLVKVEVEVEQKWKCALSWGAERGYAQMGPEILNPYTTCYPAPPLFF